MAQSYSHHGYETNIDKHFHRIERHLHHLENQMEQLMISGQTMLDRINAVSTKEDALQVLAEAQKTNLGEVKAQLQAMIDAGTGDQTALQSALDKLQEMETHADTVISDLTPQSPPPPGP